MQLLLLQFFSPVSRCTRNLYFDLTKQQFIFFNFLKNGWVARRVMANMQGMRSLGSAGEGAGRQIVNAESAGMRRQGRKGACSPNEPGCGNICSGLSFTSTLVHKGKVSASAHGSGWSVRGMFPSRCLGEERARRAARSPAPAALGSVAGEQHGNGGDKARPSTRGGRGDQPLSFRAPGGAPCCRWCVPASVSPPQQRSPQTKPRASHLWQPSRLSGQGQR